MAPAAPTEQPSLAALREDPSASDPLASLMQNNPMVDALTSNPEFMRSMIMSNPQMQRIIDENPEIAQVINDPAYLRQMSEMMRNPRLMQEMMRNTDRALTNIENIPGGFNHLRRLYSTVQEPLAEGADAEMVCISGICSVFILA